MRFNLKPTELDPKAMFQKHYTLEELVRTNELEACAECGKYPVSLAYPSRKVCFHCLDDVSLTSEQVDAELDRVNEYNK